MSNPFLIFSCFWPLQKKKTKPVWFFHIWNDRQSQLLTAFTLKSYVFDPFLRSKTFPLIQLLVWMIGILFPEPFSSSECFTIPCNFFLFLDAFLLAKRCNIKWFVNYRGSVRVSLLWKKTVNMVGWFSEKKRRRNRDKLYSGFNGV